MVDELKGIIYLRDNEWFEIRSVIKLGVSSFAKDRSSTYITGEPERGEYIYAIEIPLDKMKLLDKSLKSYLKSYHIYKGGGTEFYNKCIIDLIEQYLQKTTIQYKILTKDEILLMNRNERVKNMLYVDKVKKLFNQINLQKTIQKYKDKKNKNQPPPLLLAVKPNEQQKHILDNISLSIPPLSYKSQPKTQL